MRDGIITQEQYSCFKKLEGLLPHASCSHFRSMRMKLAWLANTSPDSLLEISHLAWVTEGKLDAEKKECIRRFNRAIRYAVQNRISPKIPGLDMETLKFIACSDSSFANNADPSSQLDKICLLGDHAGSVVPIHFKYYKSRRATTSSMAGEVIAFSDLKYLYNYSPTANPSSASFPKHLATQRRE